MKIFRHATVFHLIRATMFDYTDDTRHVRHLSRSRLSLLSRRKSSFRSSFSLDRRSHLVASVSSFPISFRSITDPHDSPRAHGALSARDRLPMHVPRVAIDEWKSSHTVHCKRSPVCRFRAMTWRTSVREISHGLDWSLGRLTMTRDQEVVVRVAPTITVSLAEWLAASPNGVRPGCIERAHSSLSGGRSSLSPVPSSLPSSSRARSGNPASGGEAGRPSTPVDWRAIHGSFKCLGAVPSSDWSTWWRFTGRRGVPGGASQSRVSFLLSVFHCVFKFVIYDPDWIKQELAGSLAHSLVCSLVAWLDGWLAGWLVGWVSLLALRLAL